MIDVCNIYEIDIAGFSTKIKVTYYTLALEGKTSGPPGNCYPPEVESIDWCAATGVDLLDEYIEADTIDIHKEIEEQLSHQIAELFQTSLDDKAEAAYDAKQERNYDRGR